ncbi:coiled-coil domain-containing protein 69 isoform X2 [Brachyhypopomus gauderio]|uniref:coiled-coil domain-containing protein 69 isoform X2 n=1 Tax=Brachyhypopomus gauderio TaxID=698409 RepID=UPI00404189A2
MGCHYSKMRVQSRQKKKYKAKGEKRFKDISGAHDGNGKVPTEERVPSPETELEEYKWQLKVLHEALAASGSSGQEHLLREHEQGDLLMLVHRIAQKVKNETAARLDALYEEQVTRSAEQYQKDAEVMQHLHNKEKSMLEEAHMASECALKEQIEGLIADLKRFTELKERVKSSTLQRDLQKNIQTHGSPGEFWEQEQESLLIVIEMKKERLQEQGSKLQQMEALIEKNLALENQVKQVQQQNEDLRVRLDSYQTIIKQLSKEQNRLEEAQEKQFLQNQKLTQEKEELLFKLLHNGDSCSAFHRAAIVPTQVSPN